MLVLVLILVVIALVLLLAGWFLHVVALAWTSVAISLIAGLALLYDWWQTRSAVRAGDRRDTAQGAPAGNNPYEHPPAEAHYGSDPEPATQVLPVVRPQQPAVGQQVPGGGAAADNAADATIQIPFVRPPGSAGAPPVASRSSGSQSPSVTESGGDGTEGSTGGHPAGAPSAPAADGGPEHRDDAGRGGDPTRTGDPGGAVPADGPAAADESTAGRRENGGPGTGGPERSADPAVTGAAGATVVGLAAGGSDRSPDAVRSGADDGPGTGGADATRAVQTGSPAGATGRVEAATTAVPAAGGMPVTGNGAEQPPVSSGEPAGAGATTALGAAGAAGADAGVPPGGDAAVDAAQDGAEAPEEPRDPTLANLVARLPDEVLVIDEHPRYHVESCRTLAGRQVIPLPVSEAVELGFTPCGQCTPNRTLGEQHPAQVR
ncbi:hypothetical protein [Pseudonocardia sp. HH130630-07]|uniref:hypothetical protein n=1 Tax=Pseudonocardia sp. HH130630-07 TaxID=1690815 RepID=UPI000814BD11|nr:hypothetical protein [Pseudonocardia sp. HH130630-07]ANY05082.1 hypothetical protein AFB00_00670 [Pseudonocardia sp. HH130630-07]